MWKNEHRTNAEKPMWNMHDSIKVAKSMWIQGCKTVKVQVSQIHADSDKIWENLVCWDCCKNFVFVDKTTFHTAKSMFS